MWFISDKKLKDLDNIIALIKEHELHLNNEDVIKLIKSAIVVYEAENNIREKLYLDKDKQQMLQSLGIIYDSNVKYYNYQDLVSIIRNNFFENNHSGFIDISVYPDLYCVKIGKQIHNNKYQEISTEGRGKFLIDALYDAIIQAFDKGFLTLTANDILKKGFQHSDYDVKSNLYTERNFIGQAISHFLFKHNIFNNKHK